MEIKKDNVATYGLRTWEQTGTIAFDFANYLDRLTTIKDIDFRQLASEGWYQVGFRFDKSLIENGEKLNLDIVLSKVSEDDKTLFGYISRTINKKDFLNLVVNFTAQISNQVHFERDDIEWQQLSNLEE